MRIILFCLVSFLVINMKAQNVLINEIDADQPGADSTEFVELIGDPGTPLDGYVLVFFNGGDPNNASYQSVDLSGNAIPTSGFFVVGNANVSNVNLVIANNSLQNGADAVVLYNNTTIDAWPNGTAPALTGALDAVVYGTADAEDVELMSIFAQGQTQLDEGAANNTTSLSRVPDGGAAFTLSLFVAQNPTPGATNGGSSVGVIESFSHQLSVFPNPAQEELFIQSESDIQMLNLYDNQGKCIFKGAPFSKNYNVDVRAWAPGIYMIKLQTQSGISTLQWIKQ